MAQSSISLASLARAGFRDLAAARDTVVSICQQVDVEPDVLLAALGRAADPETALEVLIRLHERAGDTVAATIRTRKDLTRAARLFGASEGLGDFFVRAPDELGAVLTSASDLPTRSAVRASLLAAVGAHDGAAQVSGEAGRQALRVRYRRLLAQIVAVDLESDDPVSFVDEVGAALSDLAGAALDASLAVARADLVGSGPGQYPHAEVEACRLAIIGMGKTGAHELNYVSDVDVIFVAEPHGEAITPARAVDIGTRLATLTMRGVDDLSVEPALWQVDTALRPEGRDGALVRTLESHLAYYRRWAKAWEFQALLKADICAGDQGLAQAYVEAIDPFVWAVASSRQFVHSVQRMRERITENIPADELEQQLKLGPGGLRDVEFTVQLLQLVHGQADDRVRQRATTAALVALADAGYIGRSQAAEFIQDYRELRLMEHRLQLRQLRRTHLMPRDDDQLRVLARATGLAPDARALFRRWQGLKRRVRGLHERLFYRPLLAAVAALPGDEALLTSEQAAARLSAIGFEDPSGALKHMAALSGGISRRAAIQRTLLPVLLQWFADGADPDYGLRTFRRLSEDLGATPWFLRMLRDTAGAAQRLTTVLAGSRFVGELLGHIPESVAWLGNTSKLAPRPRAVLHDEMRALVRRHETLDAVAATLRAQRRRETLRLAFGAVLHLCTVTELAQGLSDINEIHLQGVLAAIMEHGDYHCDFAIIGMGRLGGREVGMGSDADVMYVYRVRGGDAERAGRDARAVVAELTRLCTDLHLPLSLDADLRPEGKSGPIARTIESYESYYAKWSVGWEAQALLRARGIAGDQRLLSEFDALVEPVRYPTSFPEASAREIKRIKARVESERLPQGADPWRHVKLGRGSISDVEWFVQLLQLEHAHTIASMRTTSTLEALAAAEEHGLLAAEDASLLREAWLISSRVRTAMTLWLNKTTDVLPHDREQLEGIARLMGYTQDAASALEEDYLAATRRARSVFERGFYGIDEHPTTRA